MLLYALDLNFRYFTLGFHLCYSLNACLSVLVGSLFCKYIAVIIIACAQNLSTSATNNIPFTLCISKQFLHFATVFCSVVSGAVWLCCILCSFMYTCICCARYSIVAFDDLRLLVEPVGYNGKQCTARVHQVSEIFHLVCRSCNMWENHL